MKRFILTVMAIFASATLLAAPSCKLSGFPVTKKSSKPVIGALVTLSEIGNKSNKFQRLVGEEGFTIIVPYGEYNLTIEAEGYETYTLEIDLDEQATDLGVMKMLTDKMAEERDNAKAERKKR